MHYITFHRTPSSPAATTGHPTSAAAGVVRRAQFISSIWTDICSAMRTLRARYLSALKTQPARRSQRTRRILLYIYRPLSTLQRERPCNVQSKMNTHTINVHENVHDCEGETYRNSYMHVPSPNPHPHSVALCVPRHTLAPRPGTDLQHEIAACVETRESQPPVAQTLRIHGHEGLVAYPLLVAVALVAHQVKPSPGTSSRPPERQLIKLT